MPEPTEFAHSLTLDTMVLEKDEDASRSQDKYATICFDVYSKWLQGYAATSKSAFEVGQAIGRFLGPRTSPDYVYSDNSLEIKRAMQDKGWADRHDTSTPNRPQNNGTIERCVRKVKEGISAILLQSGLNPEWWADAMRCFCFLHCVAD